MQYSCSEESVVDNNNNINVTASIISSRTVYSSANGNTYVSWAEGDRIGVFAEGYANLRYTAETAGEKTTFSGGKFNADEGDVIYAYYPYKYMDVFDEIQNGGIPCSSIMTQYQNNGLSTYDAMYARGLVKENHVDLEFHHMFAVLRITFPTNMLSGLPGNRIGIISNESICTFADGAYYPDTQKFSIIQGHSIECKITYNLDAKSLKEETVTCEIVILPQSELAKIEIQDIPYTSSNRKPNTLVVKSAPKGGFKAGYVYSLNLTTGYDFDCESDIEDMPEHEWTY